MMSCSNVTVESILKPFRLTLDDYKNIKSCLSKELIKGLCKDTNSKASVKMFPTHVRATPNGTEKGKFLALDLGGSNFRVLCVTVDGKHIESDSHIYKLGDDLMQGSGQQLFDYIADCLVKFMKEHDLCGERLPLGFTFSFPCQHLSLTCAILTKWTKGFSASGVASQDVGVLLSESLKRKEVSNIELVAVVNDTTGALVSCAHQYPDCQVSLILGTGSNCSYMESLDNVELWTADQDGEPKQVIIDTEWGAFGDDGTIDEYRTNLDKELDNHTPNKGRQRFEKMISGLYLGEVVRLILKQLAEHKLIFDGVLSKELQTRSRFETRFISQIEEEAEEKYEICKQVLQELGIIEPTIEDCRIIKMVCQVVSTRAAWMAAAGLGAVVDKLGMKNTTVGMDGSLYLKHPTIHDIMRVAINELSPSTCVKFVHAEDGSGRGAALVAAVSDRLNKKCFNSI